MHATHVNVYYFCVVKMEKVCAMLCSSRSTDAKTSETPVVDDVTHPSPNSFPGEQQQQQQRVYKKVNKRVNKKMKRES